MSTNNQDISSDRTWTAAQKIQEANMITTHDCQICTLGRAFGQFYAFRRPTLSHLDDAAKFAFATMDMLIVYGGIPSKRAVTLCALLHHEGISYPRSESLADEIIACLQHPHSKTYIDRFKKVFPTVIQQLGTKQCSRIYDKEGSVLDLANTKKYDESLKKSLNNNIDYSKSGTHPSTNEIRPSFSGIQPSLSVSYTSTTEIPSEMSNSAQFLTPKRRSGSSANSRKRERRTIDTNPNPDPGNIIDLTNDDLSDADVSFPKVTRIERTSLNVPHLPDKRQMTMEEIKRAERARALEEHNFVREAFMKDYYS